MSNTKNVKTKGQLLVKALSVILAFVFLSAMFSGCGKSGEVALKAEDIVLKDSNVYSCSYNGIERSFLEFPPDGDVKGIVFMLHGSASDGRAFRLYTGLDGPANERGYSVIYVNAISNPDDVSSPSGWNSGIGASPVDDIGFLKALAVFYQGKYGLTKEETFAAGFSNGAFMMYRIALEGQEYFSAVASVAGMMPAAMWSNRDNSSGISLLQINGTRDDVVPMNSNGTSKYTKAPAIEDVIDYFVTASGLTETASDTLSEWAVLTRSFSKSKNTQVWQVLIKEGRHSWPDKKYCGFDTNSLILDFFDAVQCTPQA